MNRIVFCLALMIALLGVQGMSLHAHLPHAEDKHATAQHDNLHIHSHVVDENLDADNDHPDAVSIDLLTSVFSRDNHFTPSIDIAFQAILILAALVVWTCSQRIPPPALILTIPSPRLRKPSSRAPPF
ncbi:MAG: hypothetical protein QM709_12950 [Spongiibacteraceae bacterium]